MVASSVLDQSIQQLEKSDWGEPETGETSLIQDCLRLRRVPIRNLTLHDLVTLIGQSIGLDWLVPLALERLRKEPLTEAFYYDGDLLAAVLSVKKTLWGKHATWYSEIDDIARRAFATLCSPSGRQKYTHIPAEALTEAYRVFQSAGDAV
jgi:hypothetical protein